MKSAMNTSHSLRMISLIGASAFSYAKADPLNTPEGSMHIATGSEAGGCTRLARDIKAVSGEVANGYRVRSIGGLQNLTMLCASEADTGFAQVDWLTNPVLSGDANVQQLLAPMPMDASLLHVVTLQYDIQVL